jgi:hypothetical protein
MQLERLLQSSCRTMLLPWSLHLPCTRRRGRRCSATPVPVCLCLHSQRGQLRVTHLEPCQLGDVWKPNAPAGSVVRSIRFAVRCIHHRNLHSASSCSTQTAGTRLPARLHDLARLHGRYLLGFHEASSRWSLGYLFLSRPSTIQVSSRNCVKSCMASCPARPTSRPGARA